MNESVRIPARGRGRTFPRWQMRLLVWAWRQPILGPWVWRQYFTCRMVENRWHDGRISCVWRANRLLTIGDEVFVLAYDEEYFP